MNNVLMLIGLSLLLSIASGCSYFRSGDDVEAAGDAIQAHAVKANPALRGQRLRVSGVIDDPVAGDPCACLKVCDAGGNNCTACSCSPPNCGTCD